MKRSIAFGALIIKTLCESEERRGKTHFITSSSSKRASYEVKAGTIFSSLVAHLLVKCSSSCTKMVFAQFCLLTKRAILAGSNMTEWMSICRPFVMSLIYRNQKEEKWKNLSAFSAWYDKGSSKKSCSRGILESCRLPGAKRVFAMEY